MALTGISEQIERDIRVSLGGTVGNREHLNRIKDLDYRQLELSPG